MKTTGWLVVLGALAAASAGPALAQERGVYLGGSIGEAQYLNICNDFAPLTGCNDSDTGFRGFAGFHFTRGGAVEIGYVDFGDASADGALSGTPVGLRLDGTGFDVSVVVSIPVMERLSILGRLGAYYVKSHIEGISGGVAARSSHTNGGFTFGAGVGFELGRLGLRAEWQRYDSALAGGVVPEEDVNFFSLGALLRF
jgi:OOP family OmpA-OmpF porin